MEREAPGVQTDMVEQIVDMVARSSVREVTVRGMGFRVTVRKDLAPSAEGPWPQDPSHLSTDTAQLLGEGGRPVSGATEDGAADAWVIRAQRVGVFRHADPCVAIGMSVIAGQPVGTIVSMNLPSEVRANRDGIVASVLVEDGSPVEYGQPLFSLAAPGDLPCDRGVAPALSTDEAEGTP